MDSGIRVDAMNRDSREKITIKPDNLWKSCGG
jgi:hypothetical protein